MEGKGEDTGEESGNERKKGKKKGNTGEIREGKLEIPGGAPIFSASPSRFHPARLLSFLTTQPP